MLRAFKNFSQFRGNTETELLAWLRRILARLLADQVPAVPLTTSVVERLCNRRGEQQGFGNKSWAQSQGGDVSAAVDRRS